MSDNDKQPNPNVEVWQCPDCGLQTTTAHALYECVERLREKLKEKDARIRDLERLLKMHTFYPTSEGKAESK